MRGPFLVTRGVDQEMTEKSMFSVPSRTAESGSITVVSGQVFEDPGMPETDIPDMDP